MGAVKKFKKIRLKKSGPIMQAVGCSGLTGEVSLVFLLYKAIYSYTNIMI